MQRTKFIAASAVGIAASLAGAGLAVAQAPAPEPSQGNLQADDRDYGGHRVLAIAELKIAESELDQARATR